MRLRKSQTFVVSFALLAIASRFASFSEFSFAGQLVQVQPARVEPAAVRNRRTKPYEELEHFRKSRPDAQWQWFQYCKKEGKRTYDPRKHPENFVRRFLELQGQGMIPPVALATSDMVRQVDRLKSSEDYELWVTYSKKEGHGLTNPRLNSAEFVQRFFDNHKHLVDHKHIVDRRGPRDTMVKGHKLRWIPPELPTSQTNTTYSEAYDVNGTFWDATPIKRYPKMLKNKIDIALRVLLRCGRPLPTEIDAYESARTHYRMRAYFNVEISDGGFEYWKDQRRIVSYSRGSLKLNEALHALRPYMLVHEELRNGLHQIAIHTTSTGDAVVMLAYKTSLPHRWRALAREFRYNEGIHIVGLAIPPERSHLSWWGERQGRIVCYRDSVFEEFKCGDRVLKLKQSVGCFSQPNHGICQRMLQWIDRNVQTCTGDLLELYCGSGCFTLALAHKFRQCLATEISNESVQLAKGNAARNHINNALFLQIDSEDLSAALERRNPVIGNADHSVDITAFDFRTVLVDPPRDGLDSCTRRIIKEFDSVLYISCNPVALARDLSSLAASHAVKSFAFFDQFPYTPHLECAVLLEREAVDSSGHG